MPKGSSRANIDRKMPVSLNGAVGCYLGKGWCLDSTKGKHVPPQHTPCWASSMTFYVALFSTQLVFCYFFLIV